MGEHRSVSIAAPRTLYSILDKCRYVVRVVLPRTMQRTPFNVLLYTHRLRGGLLLVAGTSRLEAHVDCRETAVSAAAYVYSPRPFRYVMSFVVAGGGNVLRATTHWPRTADDDRDVTAEPDAARRRRRLSTNPLIPHMLTRRITRVTLPSSNTAGPAVRHTPNVDVAVTSFVVFRFRRAAVIRSR